MTVRRLTRKQIGPWCDYCPPNERERATYRGVYFTKFACSEHLHFLETDDARHEASDSYQTEAEFQTGR